MSKIVTPFDAISIKNSNSSDTIFYNIVGNFIPPEWRTLTSSEGKVLSKSARQVLSLIVSRLQNDKILEGANDELNELQESYYYFEQLIGVCQKRIRQCLLELHDGGFIKLTLNTVVKHYVKCRNVPCIKLVKKFEPYKKNISTEPEKNFGLTENNFQQDNIIDISISKYKYRDKDIDIDKSNFVNKNLEISNKNDPAKTPTPPSEANSHSTDSGSSASAPPPASSNPISTLIDKAKKWCGGRKLSEFHPLTEEEAGILRLRSNREFNLSYMNKLLMKLAEQYPNNKFYNKKAVLNYMAKALTYELRQAPVVNNEGFRFKTDEATKARDEYLAEKEYSLGTSQKAQLERKIAAVFEPDIAEPLLRSCEFSKIASEAYQLKLTKNITLSDYVKTRLLQEIQAVYGQEIQRLEILPFTGNAPKQTAKTLSNGYIGLAGLNPNSIWYKVRQYLIAHYGEAVDKSWFSRLEAVEENNDSKQIKLKPETPFIGSWITGNYAQALRAACESYNFTFELVKA
ncbi:DnaA N-terminal domain-containing protein [Rickettsia endosymbiont of Ceutorhynchus obstrictus]|uniref:DnaA N-terminal domain-containing protein n=1 Tax=Rickettsia endosymbiont of Ceutorhynchus obstrictus TaxID=3066249 RepID=UPI003132ACD3